jgi:hypothetical protein
MNKCLLAIFVTLFATNAHAQPTPATAPTTQPFGKIDKADLELKSCDFEKDANAEILFDKGDVYFDRTYNLVFDRHVRIKIFNDNGKNQSSVSIIYNGGNRQLFELEQFISNVQAETINLNNGVVEITKIDKKQFYTKPIDNRRMALSFAFPDVKPRSVIEYKYSISSPNVDKFPDWYFQNQIPTRYSELNTRIPYFLSYKSLLMVTLPFEKNTDEVKALANIPSLNDEPYTGALKDNAQRIIYQLKSINIPDYAKGFSDTWEKVGKDMGRYDDFGGQFHRKLAGEEAILSKAMALGPTIDKIAFVFDEVKDQMKWNGDDLPYAKDGTAEAWGKKTGNSTEINLILNHLLQKAGLKCFPMLVSTRANGKVNPAHPSSYPFNSTVVYIPVDSLNFYILDATNRFNLYNEIPEDLLNSFGLYIDKDNQKYDLIFLQKTKPVREVTAINAEIKPDGKMTGTVEVNSFSYNRIASVEKYKTDGEEKYIKRLCKGDNSLKIAGLKLSNMETDTLPLIQNFNFTLDLTGSDERYIYFKANLFTSFFDKDFLSERRYTDIDFGFMRNCLSNGTYKLPAGYKVESAPNSVNMAMPDNSIAFKRVVGEQNGAIVVRYALYIKKPLYFKENYPEFHEFFKKMNEMMDEQVVLKKI